MHLTRLSLRNFRGIREADFTFGKVAVITGHNGTGKSSVLEAIRFLSGHALPQEKENVGPFDQSATGELSIAFEDHELDLLAQAYTRKLGKPATGGPSYTRRVVIHPDGTRSWTGSEELKVAFSPENLAQFPFADVTLVRPGKAFAISGRPVIGLGVPHNARATVQVHDGYNDPTVDTEGYLAFLDYQGMLDERDGHQGGDGFSEVAAVFREVTGQQLLRPASTKVAGATHLRVALPNGRSHGLEGLSSGERGALGLLCFGHHLRTTRGVALLDEPELHLHPSFAAVVVSAFLKLASPAQVVMVTHSPQLLAAVRPSHVIELAGSAQTGNQARQQTAAQGRVGRAAADSLLAECELIVEGSNDEEDLQTLFPGEIDRARIIQAGNSDQVLTYHRFQQDTEAPRPWIALLDRDLRTAEEVSILRKRYPNLHVWPLRALESLILYPPLIAAVYTDNGRARTPDEAHRLLWKASLDLQRGVVEVLLENKLARLHPTPKRGSTLSEEHRRAIAQIELDRADATAQLRVELAAQVEQRWEAEWLALVDPKVLLKVFHSQNRLYVTPADLRVALMTRSAQDESVRHPALEEFRLKLASLR
ncbi:AAA family ATPase [Streptomyces anulatus]|uniref:AAA family ATPase n=1 Tax=Streptomyces anulatus TaxID=1892 RepID=UPI003803D343